MKLSRKYVILFLFLLLIQYNSLTYCAHWSQESSEPSETENAIEVECPECDKTFQNRYKFLKHYENEHARKKRKRS